ncbi:MAG: hypothetical protein U0974_05720 [Gemmatimonadales bacterium]|nr:hypothetical protein [Gemmatimonadales bacterium]MDZ4389207.1 hypothetical protein [Gemmatimonadales bacterium]
MLMHRGNPIGWRNFLNAWAASLVGVLVLEGGAGFTWSVASRVGKYGVLAVGVALPSFLATSVLRAYQLRASPGVIASAAFLLAVPVAAVAPILILVASCAITGDCP